MRCVIWRACGLPSPVNFDQWIVRQYWCHVTYHFEAIELYLDLLRKHRSEPTARSNITSTVIVRTGPRIIELNARAERNILQGPMWCILGAHSRDQYSRRASKAIFTINVDRASTVIVGSAWGSRF